ncbi:hypothetical protein [Streptomyces canarius]|uniref:Uncharacterized protein n=1 Tax=Streptomyces canarius TaxID=285453 RepID=A0ABQ3DDD1_9ACTN|nr:hypothetical protein GCM10010345_80030 [Streptomyces canarius]
MATGHILTSVGDRAAAARVPARHTDDVHARTITVGRSPRGPLVQFADGSFTTALSHSATCTVTSSTRAPGPHPGTLRGGTGRTA